MTVEPAKYWSNSAPFSNLYHGRRLHGRVQRPGLGQCSPTTSMESSSFSTADHFPQRRRVAQACTACSKRKTRCDAAKPKCSWCRAHDAECVYLDSQQLRIDSSTAVLLDRIQLLEDRLFSSPVFAAGGGFSSSPPEVAAPPHNPSPAVHPPSSDADLDVQVSSTHTANANYVYEWPIVRSLLSQTQIQEAAGLLFAGHHGKTTDVFFHGGAGSGTSGLPPESWRLFRDGALPVSVESPGLYHALLHLYFREVQIFFPLLVFRDISAILREVIASEHPLERRETTISAPQYCLLLSVLALASLVASGGTSIRLEQSGCQMPPRYENELLDPRISPSFCQTLWDKATVLLGAVSSDQSLEAAQCTMLARYVCLQSDSLEELYISRAN